MAEAWTKLNILFLFTFILLLFLDSQRDNPRKPETEFLVEYCILYAPANLYPTILNSRKAAVDLTLHTLSETCLLA